MKKPFGVLLSAMFILIALFILEVIPAQVQDSDPRNYYPTNCQSGNNEWIRAPEAEEFVLTRLNQWRLAVGVAPLQRNEMLNRVAEQQTTYIRPFAPFNMPPFNNEEGNFRPWHLDAIGGLVTNRLERNGWPRYDSGIMIGSEIAAYYNDVSQSINFWQTSPVHNATATLPGFREVGINTQCWKGWLLTYVVMGARPNTLTASYDPHTNALFFGDESRSYSGYNTGFRPDFYQIQDKSGRRLHDAEWLIWNRIVQLPANAPDEISVVFTDGITLNTVDVDLRYDRTFPSQLDPTPTPTFTPSATATAGASPTPYIPTATFVPTNTPLPMNGNNYDIVLYYNQNFITIVNETGQDINLEPIAFRSQEFPPFELSFSFIAQPFVDRGGDLTRFPAHDCVQAFSGDRFAGPGRDPDTCMRRVAYRSALAPSERFWLRPNFDISYGLRVIAGCPGLQVYSQQAVCGFDLPDFALEAPRMTATPNPIR